MSALHLQEERYSSATLLS